MKGCTGRDSSGQAGKVDSQCSWVSGSQSCFTETVLLPRARRQGLHSNIRTRGLSSNVRFDLGPPHPHPFLSQECGPLESCLYPAGGRTPPWAAVIRLSELKQQQESDKETQKEDMKVGRKLLQKYHSVGCLLVNHKHRTVCTMGFHTAGISSFAHSQRYNTRPAVGRLDVFAEHTDSTG